jgi:hypothetical protein
MKAQKIYTAEQMLAIKWTTDIVKQWLRSAAALEVRNARIGGFDPRKWKTNKEWVAYLTANSTEHLPDENGRWETILADFAKWHQVHDFWAELVGDSFRMELLWFVSCGVPFEVLSVVSKQPVEAIRCTYDYVIKSLAEDLHDFYEKNKNRLGSLTEKTNEGKGNLDA